MLKDGGAAAEFALVEGLYQHPPQSAGNQAAQHDWRQFYEGKRGKKRPFEHLLYVRHVFPFSFFI